MGIQAHCFEVFVNAIYRVLPRLFLVIQLRLLLLLLDISLADNMM